MNNHDDQGAKDWLQAEIQDDLEEEYELEISAGGDGELSEELARIYQKNHPEMLPSKEYFGNLLRLQSEFIKLQTWVAHSGAKILVLFEGRDSAGKGGVIKRITQRLN